MTCALVLTVSTTAFSLQEGSKVRCMLTAKQNDQVITVGGGTYSITVSGPNGSSASAVDLKGNKWTLLLVATPLGSLLSLGVTKSGEQLPSAVTEIKFAKGDKIPSTVVGTLPGFFYSLECMEQ